MTESTYGREQFLEVAHDTNEVQRAMKYKVYPTEYVPGFVATYCKSEISAEWEQLRMQIATGVEWKIKQVTK